MTQDYMSFEDMLKAGQETTPAKERRHHAGFAEACSLHEHGGLLVVAGIDIGAGCN